MKTDPEKLADIVKGVRRCAESYEGRLFLRHLINNSGALTSSYYQEATYAAFREGQRDVGVNVLGLAQQAGVIGSLLEKEE